MLKLMGIAILGMVVIMLIVTPAAAQEATPTPTPFATATPTPFATATPTPLATATPTPVAGTAVPMIGSWGLAAFLLTITGVAVFLLRRRA